MPPEFLWLDREQLSTADETFRVRRHYPPDLAASIAAKGIQTPLLVTRVDGVYRLVSGWGRWQIGKDAGKLPCFVVADGTDENQLWDRFLRDNDRWNVVEVARVLERLADLPGWTVETIARDKLPLMGLRPAKDLHQTHLRLLGLPETVQDFIEKHNLPLRRARIFFKLPVETLPRVLATAIELRLTLNEIAEMLELLLEIASRDATSPHVVLEESRRNAPADETAKATVLRRLRERRYPQLSVYREQLQEISRTLEFSVPVKVEWDIRLERPGVRLMAELEDADALQTFHEELAANRERFGQFFEIL